MDSTLPNPKSKSKSKLPIKRKTQERHHHHPNNNIDINNPPPFKFHRIWTESDEIAFLSGLLNSNLLFPRDLNLFYNRFSTTSTLSHPYTHSQLSDKLRRLRNKFRSTTTTTLSPHDRTLHHLSQKLWSPQFSHTSPFRTCSKVEEVAAAPNLMNPNPNLMSPNPKEIVLDVFDRCLKEAKMGLFWQWQGFILSPPSNGVENFGKRWQEQRALEFDVFARRLRLVLEDSLIHHHSPNL